MSSEDHKLKHSKRLQKEENAIHKQQKIAMQNGATRYDVEIEPHRYAKHHAMDCGNPRCVMCSNPRRTWHELTAQEKREMQEMDNIRFRHSNGLLPENSDE